MTTLTSGYDMREVSMKALAGVAVLGGLYLFLDAIAALALLTTAFAILLIALGAAVFLAALYGMIATTIRSRGDASWAWLGFIIGSSLLYGLPTLAAYGLMGGSTELTNTQVSGVGQFLIWLCFFWFLADMFGVVEFYLACYGVANELRGPRLSLPYRRVLTARDKADLERSYWHRMKFTGLVMLEPHMAADELADLWITQIREAPDVPYGLTPLEEFVALASSTQGIGNYRLTEQDCEVIWHRLAGPDTPVPPGVRGWTMSRA